MSILCTTSQLNLSVLNLVQSLAKGSCRGPLKTEATTLEASPPSNSPENKPTAMKLQFSMPTEMKLGAIGKLPMSTSQGQRSTSRKMPTLNMLGMQPDFNVPDSESVYTVADSTVVSHSIFRQRGDDGDSGTKVCKPPGVDYAKHVDAQHPRARLVPAMEYSTTRRETHTPESIRTQSLIEDESIPDPLPSGITSNITSLDMMESSTTIDPGESLGKSAGLLLSRELESIEELVSSVSDTSTDGALDETDGTGPDNLTMKTTNSPKQGLDLCGVPGRGDGGMDLHQLRSPEELIVQSDNGEVLQPIKPQHQQVKVPESKRRNVDTRCTHYTHSTAPLDGGANILGSEVHPSNTLYSTASTGKSSTAVVKTEEASSAPAFVGWPSEVTMAYVTGMACCAIYGRTSLIQRTAMEGFVQEKGVVSGCRGTEVGSCGSDRENQYGLLDMVEFHEEKDAEMSKNLNSEYTYIMSLAKFIPNLVGGKAV